MKRLILITDAFPWGKGEKSFIMPELPYLKDKFKVTILSRASLKLSAQQENKAILDNDIELLHYPEPEFNRKEKIFFLCKAFFNSEFRKEIKIVIKEKKGKECLRETFFFWVRAVVFHKWMKEKHLFDDSKNTIFYSYWANYSVYSLAMEKQNNLDLKFVSRIHRYDLYNEFYPGGRQPFKDYVDKRIDKMIFIAQEGLEYYDRTFATCKNEKSKYVLCRLGIERQRAGTAKINDGKFRLVSCATVNARKRVGLIVQALGMIDGNIEWHHFGDGPLFDDIKRIAAEVLSKKDNITCILHGYTSNKDIMKYYAENGPDCFILTSESEGCPVSIQEALALGIPVIGTDVGETRYMINNNGVLLSENPTVEEVASAIQSIYEADIQQKEAMKKASLAIWERDYQLEKNVKNFMSVLESL